LGLFSFIGGLLGGQSQKSAIRHASDQQIAMEKEALAQQQQQFGVTQQNLSPWITTGTGALGAESNLLGLGGNDAQQAAINALMQSPGYQSLYRNGLEANLQNASATGGIRGGNEVRSLADFGADTLAQTIQQQLANLGGISNQGLGAATGLGGLSQANSNAQTGLYGAMGASRAGATSQIGGINAGMWNSAGGFLDSLASMIPGLGGASSIFKGI